MILHCSKVIAISASGQPPYGHALTLILSLQLCFENSNSLYVIEYKQGSLSSKILEFMHASLPSFATHRR